MLVVAMSCMFAWVLASQQVPQQAAKAMLALSSDPRLFLLFVNLLLLVAGMFLDASAALIIIAPILAPIAAQLGLDPVHFGVVVVANLGIGLATPPVGLALFVASGIARINIEEAIRPLLPFVIALIIALMVITYVPAITLFLPRLLGL
jgi:C4-dicarboxylate transporter DctM subunit